MTSRRTPPRLCWADLVEPGEEFHVARPSHTRRHPCAVHVHDFAELFWVDAGEGWHIRNGRQYRLNVGEVWFINPADAHGFEISGTNTLSITNVAFRRETAEFLRTRYFPTHGWWWNRGDDQPVTVTPERLHALNSAADRLALAPRDRLHLEHFLLGVFLELSAETVHLDLGGAPDWLATACRGIHEPRNFREGLPAFFRLASKCPEHVARMMRRTLKTTPSDYLNRVRLAHAAFQLRMTSRSITEIALDSGYENLSYFFYIFRQQHGCSPRRYRNRIAQP